MNLVSIIVAMYNEESNVQSCIETLKAQINQRFNVVFIDDGSTDNTVLNLRSFLNKGVEFSYKIIEQTNHGASEARKKGINHSLTEFIMILDCDDKLSNNLVDQVYKKYDEFPNLDIVIPGMRIQNKKGDWSNLVFYTEDIQLEPWDCIRNSLNGWRIHGCFAIKKSIIEKSYEDYKIYNNNNEDYLNNDEVITRLNFRNSKIIVKSAAKYYYCYNVLSTTKKINNKKYLMIKNALILNSLFSGNKEVEPIAQADLISVLWGVSIYMHRHKIGLNNIVEWKKLIKQTIKEIKYFNFFNKLSFKKKVQLTTLKLVNLL